MTPPTLILTQRDNSNPHSLDRFIENMALLFSVFYSNESTFEPLGISRFMQMFEYFAQYFVLQEPPTGKFGRYKQFGQEYCLERNIIALSTNIYTMSWVGYLKEFIDEDHLAESQKHTAVSLNMEIFI